MANSKPITFEQLFRYYKGLPHQMAAIQMLEEDIRENGYAVAMRRDRPWFAVWSQSGKQPDPPQAFNNTWEGVLAAARHAGAKFPCVVAAQWALESGWGEHTSGKHNYFGLKGSGTATPTREFLGGQWVTITDSFIDFPSLAACVEYLVSRWYQDYQQHHGVNRAMTRDECAKLLVSEGYATDPGYASKLISIMNRAAVKSKPAEEKPRETVKLRPGENILDVPYEYQLDNASSTGYRECFSSTCAMIARYHGQIDSDDEYNIIRARFGDTINPHTHIKALRSLGFDARFRTDCSSTTIKTEIDAGRPLGVGWLHQGSIQMPAGGGHWTCVVGYTEEAIVHNDPNGEADMINGGYVSNAATTGRGVHYSRKNWLQRWEVDGANTGWAILVRPEF